jgi:AIG2-like family
MNLQPVQANESASGVGDDDGLLYHQPCARRQAQNASKDGLIDYFAIGAMMNPISVSNRRLKPVTSVPAELLDYRLGFFTTQGYGEALLEPGASFHGVIHRLTPDEMEVLDSIETEYERVTATARLYDGTFRQVTVYTRSKKHDACICAPPGERYLEIMIAGAEHYGVHQSHINWLRRQESVPRPNPEDYVLFKPVETDLALTAEQVAENNGLNGKPLYITMNSKVIEADLDRESEEFLGLVSFVSNVGQIGELFMPKVIYDPKYGIPSSLREVTPEHAAYCEHAFCSFLKIQGTYEQWKTVAHLKVTPDESRQDNVPAQFEQTR